MSTMDLRMTPGDRTRPGVRTYRGRTLEEIIPRIRAELGPDAIILREREGLMGGVNGFFAQRCVEVDARASSQVDLYVDDELPGALTLPGVPGVPERATAVEPATARDPRPVPGIPGASNPARPVGLPGAPSGPFATSQGASPALVSASQAEAAMASRLLSFADRLELETHRPPEADLTGPEPKTGLPGAQYDLAEPKHYLSDRDYPLTEPALPAEPDAYDAFVDDEEEEDDTPSELQWPAPPSVSLPSGPAALPVLAPAPAAPVTSLPATRESRPSGHGIGRRRAKGPAVIDGAAAGPVARELIALGISETFAHELITSAGAHQMPFGAASLRDGVRAALAVALPSAPALPPGGASVAFIGAGGAGKTQCSAGLATRYGHASTLTVTAISLESADRGRELRSLLKADGRIEVIAASYGNLGRRLDTARNGGLAVLDTAGLPPTKHGDIAQLASELAAFELDAVVLAVPATVSLRAAHGLIDGFSLLTPTAMAITHADETREIGTLVELSFATRLPIAFINDGLSLAGALSRADPDGLARRLLP